jgi:hypothetical protein
MGKHDSSIPSRATHEFLTPSASRILERVHRNYQTEDRVYRGVRIEARMRQFAVLPFAALLSFVPAAAAQSAHFMIAQHGKTVGDSTVTFSAIAKGYQTTTVVHVAMQGLNYSLSKTEQLTSANHLRQVELSATVNQSAVSVSAAPDAAQITLNVSANGRRTSAHLASHPSTVFLPDFDPGALDTLLAIAVTQNDRGLWAIIPKQSGTQAGTVVPVQLATYADEKGTLNGKPIDVHHLVATIAGAKSDLFSGPGNQLLQAELPQQGFALIRNGFVLTPPAKAGAPPTLPQAPAGAQPAPRAAPPAPAPAPTQQ